MAAGFVGRSPRRTGRASLLAPSATSRHSLRRLVTASLRRLVADCRAVPAIDVADRGASCARFRPQNVVLRGQCRSSAGVGPARRVRPGERRPPGRRRRGGRRAVMGFFGRGPARRSARPERATAGRPPGRCRSPRTEPPKRRASRSAGTAAFPQARPGGIAATGGLPPGRNTERRAKRAFRERGIPSDIGLTERPERWHPRGCRHPARQERRRSRTINSEPRRVCAPSPS